MGSTSGFTSKGLKDLKDLWFSVKECEELMMKGMTDYWLTVRYPMMMPLRIGGHAFVLQDSGFGFRVPSFGVRQFPARRRSEPLGIQPRV